MWGISSYETVGVDFGGAGSGVEVLVVVVLLEVFVAYTDSILHDCFLRVAWAILALAFAAWTPSSTAAAAATAGTAWAAKDPTPSMAAAETAIGATAAEDSALFAAKGAAPASAAKSTIWVAAIRLASVCAGWFLVVDAGGGVSVKLMSVLSTTRVVRGGTMLWVGVTEVRTGLPLLTTTGQKLTTEVVKTRIVMVVVLNADTVPLMDQNDVVIAGYETVRGFSNVRGGQ
ncbi:hypothetical protein CSAL01_06113 [Colletotrichum salicis]|uniref:Uncharacterized protein n=1 Tax=Colletotrichum salicis TaxID=1209931 RepID=A0A135VAL7_9PEZI|nr:hypothetical protein CSAL01_06113 [Colletotrichum salicis]